ncbi:hypothetical protein Pcinc_037403 [Petrolisthes cinctipes]|uniref:Uncharacterized protein n=1 Tax=Petrolisthes cinctipes TaxID=88211 RepID=A0AAE1BSG1_PETCI|nr:hypothetical protein Pcinc_037403 [Petrolisthes cinctipes]
MDNSEGKGVGVVVVKIVDNSEGKGVSGVVVVEEEKELLVEVGGDGGEGSGDRGCSGGGGQGGRGGCGCGGGGGGGRKVTLLLRIQFNSLMQKLVLDHIGH